jgi:hypothetical protein
MLRLAILPSLFNPKVPLMHKQTAGLRKLIENAKHGNQDAVAIIRKFVRGCAENAPEADLLEIAQFLLGMRVDELRREAEAN